MNHRPLPRIVSLLGLLLSHVLVAAASADAPAPAPGVWAAQLECPGGPIEFEFELRPVPADAAADPGPAGRAPVATQRGWRAWLRNGRETVAVPSVVVAGNELRMDFTQYGSEIIARTGDDAQTLRGQWQRRRGSDTWTRMEFSATWQGPPTRTTPAGNATTIAPAAATSTRGATSGSSGTSSGTSNGTPDNAPANTPADAFAGTWSVDFSSSDELAVGVFERVPGSANGLTGTFLTTVGDYRFLGGRVDADGQTMRLSVFDGAHAFLFVATRHAGGGLRGDFWSRDAWHETWTATRDDDAALPDGFGLTAWNADVDLGSLRFPTPDGELVALNDPRFAGRPRIIEIFGTWCPNCNDATEYLVELHERYADRGLSILGLAFEYTGDPAIDAERVRAYRAHHAIEFPILIAGTADKAKASAALPIVDRVRAYPTMIFMDAGGAVRAIYTGFNGPATGDLHGKLREDFERIIESMLAPRRAPIAPVSPAAPVAPLSR
ncbi:MAG: TlpA disulfide reductase family protein [Phycisphaerales bacterium]